jgi:PilZ domain-containing protein
MMHIAHRLEHRWGERVQVNIPVRVSAASLMRVDGCMKNLSLSGALMRSDRELRLHALIQVHIELPPPAPRAAVLEAHVSRTFNEWVGIEWCEFAPNIVKGLLRDPAIRATA